MRAPAAKIAQKMAAPGVVSQTREILSNRFVSASDRLFGTVPSRGPLASQQSLSHRKLSSLAVVEDDDHFGPTGELFDLKRGEGINDSLLGKTAKVRRVFAPNANAHGLLATGGEELARHASFDPDYRRARGWIQNRAIGDAVLSPVLISGLVGALVEAAFPQSVPVMASMHHARPLIVGQEVNATIQVIGVKHFTRHGEDVSIKERDFGSRQEGHEIRLVTKVARTQDDEVIAEGSHSVWIPGYLSR